LRNLAAHHSYEA